MKCSKCNHQPQDESDLDLHHVIPKFMGGKDSDGRLYLCRENKGNDCHIKLRELIPIIKKLTNGWLKE